MTDKRVMNLGKRYQQFARDYVRLTESLQAEGVPEEIARAEARYAAQLLLMNDLAPTSQYDPGSGPCPACGRG